MHKIIEPNMVSKQKICYDFYAEDEDRPSPFKTDKPKDAEISPFQAGLDNTPMANQNIFYQGFYNQLPLQYPFH